MKELQKDLFDCLLEDGVDAICVTTNGNFTFQGLAIMGAGCALELKQRYPKTQVNLGRYLKSSGVNVPYIIGAVDSKGKFLEIKKEDIDNKNYKCLLISFPTKNHFKENSSIELIEQSCNFLVGMANKYNLNNIVMPRPGVGFGKLNWDFVKQKIENLLDDRFTIVSK